MTDTQTKDETGPSAPMEVLRYALISGLAGIVVWLAVEALAAPRGMGVPEMGDLCIHSSGR